MTPPSKPVMGEDQYSTEGPICPYCLTQITADDPCYYADTLERIDCDECGNTFGVTVYHETSWTTRPRTPGEQQ